MGERIFLICILTVFLLGVITGTSVFAGEEEVLFEMSDPVNDDFGPGSYRYPAHEVFSPHSGLFDLTHFRIESRGDNYIFTFNLSNITDPWDSDYGFSMPLFQLYIDNQAGGSTDLLREGANVSLQQDHPWNKLITISGWWVYVFSPRDRGQDVVDFTLEGKKLPWEIDDYDVEVIDDQIRVVLNRDLIGPLTGKHLYLLVGSFDPFGLDYFRGIKDEESLWYFHDSDLSDPRIAPRVIDILVPEGKNQQEVLADFENQYPAIYPVKIVKPVSDESLFRSGNLIAVIIFILLLTGLFIYHQKKTRD